MSELEHMKKSNAQTISTEQRRHMIAEAAYYLAERRGFQDGECSTDWLQAEIYIERMLEVVPTPQTPAKRKPRTTTPKTNAKTAEKPPEAL